MPVSIFGQFLVSERRNMRMPEKQEASIRSGVSSRPLFNEVQLEEDAGPFLVTNASRQFVPTVRSKTRGVARYGFSEIPLDEEHVLMAEMYMSVLEASWTNKWKNRCNSLYEAIERLRETDMEPSHIIVPEDALPGICGPDFNPEHIEVRMMTEGYVAELDGMHVLPGDLPSETAIVTAVSSLVGLYTRVGDYLGVMLQRVNRSMMVVGDGVA